MRAALLMCVTCFSTLSLVEPAFGWGCEGHRIVALIARAHLTPAAAEAVDDLLRENPVDPALKRFCQDRSADPMVDAATWADDAKNSEKTGTWHYVDIPLTVEEPTSLAPWCSPIGPSVSSKDSSKDRPGCITSAMDYELSVIRDRSRSPAERATALRYIIHFAGDIQQPLHDSDNNDHGGNCTALRFFAEDNSANLHSIWDYKLIEHEISERKLTEARYAGSLDGEFGDQWQEFSKGGPEDWAWEGHMLALSLTYGDLKPAIAVESPNPSADCKAERDKVAALNIAVGAKYFADTLPAINRQLAKGGYRLTALLNETF